MNILIVDDNPLMREILRETVGAFAEVIEECCDGVEVLAAFRRTRPDWVLMDWEMPLRDGIAASQGAERRVSAKGGKSERVAYVDRPWRFPV